MRRVVVTGLGAITPIGNTVEEFWENIKEGIIGIDNIRILWQKSIWTLKRQKECLPFLNMLFVQQIRL